MLAPSALCAVAHYAFDLDKHPGRFSPGAVIAAVSKLHTTVHDARVRAEHISMIQTRRPEDIAVGLGHP